MLKIAGLSKTYYTANENGIPVKLPTLQGISLSVKRGEFVSIIGPSGCGKSTLFNLISGLETPDEGSILMEGRDITGQKGHVSYMLQKDLLLPWRTILDNCSLGLEVNNVAPKVTREKAMAMLKEFGLADFSKSYPFQLSGGMRQRAAFVRTMLTGKNVFLLDEPFGALDAYTKSEMHQWLNTVCVKYKPTILFITHDVEEALLLSDRVYVMTPRPANIKKELNIGLERPRTRENLITKDFIELKKVLMDSLFAFNFQ